MFYVSYRKSDTFASIFSILFISLKKVLYPLIIIAFYSNPLVQLVLLLVIGALSILYKIIFRPYIYLL